MGAIQTPGCAPPQDFIAAIRGLAKPDSPIPEYESVALYEQLAEGSLGVDLERGWPGMSWNPLGSLSPNKHAKSK